MSCSARNISVLWMLAIVLMAAGCPPRMCIGDSRLSVHNESNLKLVILVNLHFPDTSITKAVKSAVYPKEVGYVTLVSESWEDVFRRVERITVYFADWQEVDSKKYSREDTYTILKTLSLTKADIENSNWAISYP